MKITWRSPKRSKAVIFYKSDWELLANTVLAGVSFQVIDPVKSFVVHLNPIVLMRFFLCCLKIPLFNLIKSGNFLRGLAKEFYRRYFLTVFTMTGAKVCLTIIDNCLLFHWLSRNCPTIYFGAIQNGNRTLAQLNIDTYSFTNYFCFGAIEEDRCEQTGQHVDNCIAAGSIRGDFYRAQQKERPAIKYRVAFVSQCVQGLWQGDGSLPQIPGFKFSHDLLLTHLGRFVREANISCGVFCRYGETDINTLEIAYLKKFLPDTVTFVKNDQKAHSTYRGMDESEVIVTFFSTAAREAVGWGKKVLFCDYTGTSLYNDFWDASFLLTDPSYEAFKKRLRDLIEMPLETYHQLTGKLAARAMRYDENNPSFSVIRHHIAQALL